MSPAPQDPAFIKPHRKELGRKLREARENRQLSQERLGEEAGVDRKTVNRIENGHISPSHDLLVDLADALDVELTWLVQKPDSE